MPLAAKLRPNTIDTFIGQQHLIGTDGPLLKLINQKTIPSMIFWGPPASGKTTLAQIIANTTGLPFYTLSAVNDGKSSLRKIVQQAKEHQPKQTILFIDEIHRWSKSQQDALLPLVEDGSIILIGATTENPSFTVISPLLSRSRVFVFNSHTIEDIIEGLQRAITYLQIKVDVEVLTYLAELSNGDMRFALNTLEITQSISKNHTITKQLVEQAAQRFLRYDKNGEEHYNLISAVHKSLRSSNSTAATYWLIRMLEGGEDPLYIARRLIRFASEDIGNANPNALLLANMVYDTCHKIGRPECDVALVQLVDYLAKCQKSNRAYTAMKQAQHDAKSFGNLPVPLHLRNAPTKLMKDLGYSKGYEYDHDLKNKKSDQQCMPDQLQHRDYYNN